MIIKTTGPNPANYAGDVI